MSKELTEQWRNGTLKKGLYYTLSTNGHKRISFHIGSSSHIFSPYSRLAKQTKEVLAEVPTYEEWVKTGTWYTKKSHNELLEKNDELQQRIEELEAQNAYECECNKEYAETIKKNKELESRLKEAEEVIKYAVSDDPQQHAFDGEDVVDAIVNKCNLYLKKYERK